MDTYFYQKISDIEQRIKSCNRCELHTTRKKAVVGVGDIKSNIVLVGECPGPDEDKAGVPFVGRAGKLLREMLAELTVDTDKLYITNIVKCFPKTASNPSLNPTEDNISCCQNYIKEQINLIKPKLIVTLGSIATKYFLGKNCGGITKISGKLKQIGEIKILPVLHPSYILRGNMSKSDYLIHFINILRYYNE